MSVSGVNAEVSEIAKTRGAIKARQGFWVVFLWKWSCLQEFQTQGAGQCLPGWQVGAWW